MPETPASKSPSAHVTREPVHHRRLDFHGFSRSDGLFEIEAHVTDSKPREFTPPSGARRVAPGAPIHDMVVRVVFDRDMIIQAIETRMDAHPYPSCIGGGDTLQSLVGVRLGRGWNAEVRKRLPSGDTCTHLKEVLTPLASAAYQSMTEYRLGDADVMDSNGRPAKIDSCHAYGVSRALVLQRWPAHHRPAAEAE